MIIVTHMFVCLFVCLFVWVKPTLGKRARERDLFACSLEFRRTLKIIARILREVVNRVKLGDQHTRRRSRGEVQSRVVVRRQGTKQNMDTSG